MYTKASQPAALLSPNAHPLIQAYFQFNHQKQLYRKGWLLHGIPPERCESVSEHTLGVAFLALWLHPQSNELDLLKVLLMALLHDLGEVYAGDIVPGENVSSAEKHKREKAGLAQVLKGCEQESLWLSIWDEFEAGETPEARRVRQLDKLEMALQASVYQRQKLLDPQEFWDSARREIQDADLLALVAELQRMAA